jgi:hypothetical protein
MAQQTAPTHLMHQLSTNQAIALTHFTWCCPWGMRFLVCVVWHLVEQKHGAHKLVMQKGKSCHSLRRPVLPAAAKQTPHIPVQQTALSAAAVIRRMV